ncbi:MAG: hypothetical protein IJ458_04140 [Clostridia bacterium]|nr:hypothetical protein [Clostridia bacterium]
MEINECKSCGGRVEFSPKHKGLKCVNCGSIYSIKYTQSISKRPVGSEISSFDMQKWQENNHSYTCQNCGANIVLNKMDITSTCKYCNTNSLVPLEDLPGLKPEIIIPFKISKDDAKTEFNNRIKKRKFLPLNFKKNLPKADIGATYISSFTFEMLVTATYSGRLRISKTVRDKDGRTRTVYEYRPISGNVRQQFDNLVVEASDKINQDEIMDIFPYDFNESYDYDDDFVKGYNVGYYNQTVEQAEIRAKHDAVNIIERQIHNKYSDPIESLTIKPVYLNINYNYALLPTYFVTFSYKNKSYINVMNGQTGKIGGKVPRSGVKITLFTLFIILAIGLPILFILLSN